MTFPAPQLQARLDGQSGPFPLKSVDGSRLGEISREDLIDLIDDGDVCGIGSHQRLRYFQLTADNEELETKRARKNANLGATRARTPLDLLLKMSSSRKTTFVQRLEVIRGGRIVMAAIHQHKGISLGRATAV